MTRNEFDLHVCNRPQQTSRTPLSFVPTISVSIRMNNSVHQVALRPQRCIANAFVSSSTPFQQCTNKYFPHHKQVTLLPPNYVQQYRNTRRAHAKMMPMSVTAADGERRRLGVMASGGGRSVENLCELIDRGKLKRCEIVMMIASKSNAGALERVQRFGITTKVMRPRDYDDSSSFSQAISSVFDDFAVDFIVMAGWMHFYVIPDRYLSKVINIHPSLIPSFCGKGYYGDRVHKAVVSLSSIL